MGIVELKNVSRVYRNGDHEQQALDHVDLSLEEGKFIVVLGPSGAGKSTLLNMLGVLIGLPAGVGVLQYLLTALASEYEMKLTLGPATYGVSILLTFGVSLIVGLMVARKNRFIDMVAALKTEE